MTTRVKKDDGALYTFTLSYKGQSLHVTQEVSNNSSSQFMDYNYTLDNDSLYTFFFGGG